MKRYIGVGHLSGNSEESVFTFMARDIDHAEEVFRQMLYTGSGMKVPAGDPCDDDSVYLEYLDEDEGFNHLAASSAGLLRAHKETTRSLERRQRKEFETALRRLKSTLKKLGVPELPERWAGGRKRC